MRRIALTAVATVVGLVLLLGFKSHGSPRGGVTALGVASAPPTGSTSPAGSGPSPASTPPVTPGNSAASPTRSTPAPASTTPPRPPASAAPRTITGQAVDTPYGNVQVVIRVGGGRITQIGVSQVPLDTARDRAINSYAVPQLDQEALAAQSAHIDSVSGASYTSQGYIASLQSALDMAGLA